MIRFKTRHSLSGRLAAFLAVGAIAAAILAWPAHAADASRPNVVVVLADDLGYADVGFNGCRDIPTPNIDRIAAEGVRFSSGYVSHPYCSPTRAGLMTGRYQHRFGHENNPDYVPEDATLGLPIDQTTIADVMRSAGYTTGVVGKWHLGAHPQFHPNERGFDEFFGFIGGGHDYFTSGKTPIQYQVPIMRNGEPLWLGGMPSDAVLAEWQTTVYRDRKPQVLKEYLTTLLGQEAADFVKQHKSVPFYLYLAFNAPHTPMQAPDEYLSRFASIADEKRQMYAAMVSAMDDAVGVLLEALDEQQLADNTLVFFLSDNGGPLAVNGSVNAPLRGSKGTAFEGGIRVPFAARWPARFKAHTTYDKPVICLDLLPTAAAVAGAQVPNGVDLDGVNLIPYVTGEDAKPPHAALFWRSTSRSVFAAREGNYKLVGGELHELALFDLASDVGEQHDVSADKPEVVAALKAAYDAWDAEMIAPRWTNPQPGRRAKSK